MKNSYLIFFFFVFVVFFSCGQKDQIQHIEKEVLNGKYEEFYDNGNLKVKHIYNEGVKVDSSIYLYKTGNIRQIMYHLRNDSVSLNKLYDEFNNKIAEGYSLKNDKDYRIGKWIFYENSLERDSIVEYINVDKNPYVNQVWILNSITGDTIRNKGNFFHIYMRDTVSLGEILHIRCYLYLPYYSYNSEMEVVLPKNDDELENDFSNFDKIEKEIFYSLKNDDIPHMNIPNSVPKNHYADFGLKYKNVGEKRIRGAIVEYINVNIKTKNGLDSITRLERRLFFDRKIYVK